MRACGSRRASGMRRRWTSPHGLCGSFSRTMIFNFGAAIMLRAASAESQGAGRKCLTRSSGERMVADTKWISAMHQSASKSTPATRPSRFLLRQILRPMRRNADASRSSTFHGTCSVRLLARLPGVRQRAASKTEWIADGRLGSSVQHVSNEASQEESTAPAALVSTRLWSNRPGQAQRKDCLAHTEAPSRKGAADSLPKRHEYRVIAAYTEEHSPTSAGPPASRVPKWCRRSCPWDRNPVHPKGNPGRGGRRGFRNGGSRGLGGCVTVLSMEHRTQPRVPGP